MHLTFIPPTLVPILTTLLLILPTTVKAWGSLGHRTTTAYALLLIPRTHPAHLLLTTLLHNQDPTTASVFPDRIRYIPSFAYTAPWHYIDAHDDPPWRCDVNLSRDCGDGVGGEGGGEGKGCVVSAIANHTSRVRDRKLEMWARGQSLRFMLHFFGDVHMPLHTEGLGRGGNDIAVLFDNMHTNLHSVWDTLIPHKIVSLAAQIETRFGVDSGVRRDWDVKNETQAAYAWADFLYARYGDDERIGEAVQNVCVHDAESCALSWAREANAWVCKYVLRDGVDALQGQDLGEEYFEGAVGVVEEMLIKGGRRLAKWLMVTAEELELEGLEGQGDWEKVVVEQEL